MSLPAEYDPKLWLGILAEIDQAGGKAKPADIYPRMRQYFPQITDADVTLRRKTGENVWTNTIQWVRMHLVYHGCIDNSSRGVWTITPVGKAWLQQEWHGGSADYSTVKKPPSLVKRLSKGKAKQTTPTAAEPVSSLVEKHDPFRLPALS